jgi:hypothetical protein
MALRAENPVTVYWLTKVEPHFSPSSLPPSLPRNSALSVGTPFSLGIAEIGWGHVFNRTIGNLNLMFCG